MVMDIKTYNDLFRRHNNDAHTHQDIFTNLQQQIDVLKRRYTNLEDAIADIYSILGKCVSDEIYMLDTYTGNLSSVYVANGNIGIEKQDTEDCGKVRAHNPSEF